MAYSSNDFLGIVKLWESLFADYHRHAKDGLSREFDVVKNFTRVIEEKFPEFEYKEIIQKFALSRTCFRMRALGRKLAAEKAETYRGRCKQLEYAESYSKVQYFTIFCSKSKS